MWKLRCVISRVVQLSCLALLFLSVPAVFGQSDNGSIVGFAKDPSGAVVPKAKVTLKNESTGVIQRETSNDAGYYVFNSIPSGLYTVDVEASGFKKFDSVHNKLDANSTLQLDATLTVGATSETVEVVASATPRRRYCRPSHRRSKKT
jgi:hypothetical protein